jgi:hypothetical protein
MESMGLTKKQKQALEFLWIKYGNGGSMHTKENHIFLHAQIEGQMDVAKSVEHVISRDCRKAFQRIVDNDFGELGREAHRILDAIECGML